MDYYLENAVDYHYDGFTPAKIDFSYFIGELVNATEAIARFDQMLKTCITKKLC